MAGESTPKGGWHSGRFAHTFAAIDLGKEGIHVCVVHPGWVQTDMGGAQAPLTPVQSAADLRQTLERVRAHRAQYQGAFLNHDGSPLPW